MKFSSPTSAWFAATFEAPTAAQEQGWAAIGRGEHTLILAPTGSGKTLAAFLWAIDRLLTSPPVDAAERCRVLYVSPLKALTYDVERNLRAPLTGIAREAGRLGIELPEVRVGTRTGDTPAEDRRAMAKRPPDILITTPESLYLLLTSNAASVLRGVRHVIVDEIHAMAGTKRGAHLALSLERLEELTERPPQRIGLSATQRPLDELARFLGGRGPGGGDRPVTIVDAGVRKTLELSIVVPVEDMGELGRPLSPPSDDDGADLVMRGPAAGTPEVRSSIWPAVYPRILELIRAHRSTLIFVNSRRLAERLAARLNELAAGEEDGAGDQFGYTQSGSGFHAAGAPPELVRAHHGSIAREQRLEIEDALKAGRLPALVATSSLELGIDMGAIDLVIQVEAPTSVASGLQRIGRAGHHVGEPSKGRIFPKFRHDLLVAAVVAQRMHAGLVEETRVPRNPLDVLAQQIVAMVAASAGPVPVDQVAAVVRRAYPFADLGGEAFDGVLDMLAGRYPSDEFAELRPRLLWDRVAGTLTARPGAKMLAVTSGGTIPDRGLFGVFTPNGGRVGELDEEMVYESRVGETFLLGATTWRIEDITRDRVVVTPAPGVPGKMPFWHGDVLGRPYELGVAVGAFTRRLARMDDAALRADHDLDDLAVRNLRAYVAEEMEATGGLLPTDRQIVVERFRDELGDWRVAVLSPFGARVHAPWAMAIEAKLRHTQGVDVQAVWSDDGIIVRLPEAEDAPPTDAVMIDPDEIEELVVGAIGDSALFAARFRENAARSLLLPRRRPGARTPLWQLRQRAADLLAVASKYGQFPILLETYRECLRDAFDLPALTTLLRDVAARKVRVATVELPSPSPFASGLAFAYVAQFMYEGDAPLAERRAQALTLDRRMLAELLGTDELRDLLDASVLTALEAELQALDERRWASSVDQAADLLRRLGDLTPAELVARCTPEVGPGVVDALLAERRAAPVRVAGEERLIAAEEAGRYRDGLGVTPPPGLADAFLEPVPDGLVQILRRWARVHGPFVPAEPAARFGLSAEAVVAVLDRLAGEGRLERGAFRPGGSGRDEWCDTDVLRILRQRSLAALRKEVAPAETAALVRFLPAWHGVAAVGRPPAAGGLDRLFEVVGQLQGFAIPASVLETDVLPARVRGYQPRMLDELMAAGEVMWVGAGSLGRSDGRIVLGLRQQAPLLWRRMGFAGGVLAGMPSPADPAPVAGAPPAVDPALAPGAPPAAAGDVDGETHRHLRRVLAERGACFFRELGLPGASDQEIVEALWDLVWAGEVTGDAFAAVRATVAVSGSGRRAAVRRSTGRPGLARPRPRLGGIGVLGPPRGQGRWSLVERELGLRSPTPTEAGVAVAGQLLERHGVLTRDAVRGEGVPGGFAGIYPVLRTMEESGRIRRGYFVEGMGGAQFALAGAVDRLRSVRVPDQPAEPEPSGPDADGYRGGDEWAVPDRVIVLPAARGVDSAPGTDGSVLVLAATDPANAFGLSVPWPVRGPTRVPGAYVVLVDGELSLYVERGGKGLVAARELDGAWEGRAIGALSHLVASGRWGRLALQRWPEELEAYLRDAQFTPTPKGLVRYGS
ncbi:DEAD/DEAH box helicase [Acidiferrimicrobium sp. IK]|uniref:Lhr family helicase n=1 Tax=Acidiferrimicrobium sp. IK TaxID=2871700 RepID=UPI0021CB33B1|nr:DEAD/DEAH box helicase [Acidiferrimicrobium sp. IK]MCU4186918.1 DEAD/DEAH box helicase [Acidiferrimicrobium sp. IK]